MNSRKSLFFLLFLIFVAFNLKAADNYRIQTESPTSLLNIYATGKYTSRVAGGASFFGSITFSDLEGTVLLDEQIIGNSTLTFSGNFQKARSRDGSLEKYLTGPCFVEVDKNPLASFRSKKFVREGDHILIIGNLSVNGTTSQITFEMNYETAKTGIVWDHYHLYLEATEIVPPKDLGIEKWCRLDDNGGSISLDYIRISLEIEAERN